MTRIATPRNDRAPADTGNAVEVRGIVKHYGSTKALDGVDLTVRQGTVLGVLAPTAPARPPWSASCPR